MKQNQKSLLSINFCSTNIYCIIVGLVVFLSFVHLTSVVVGIEIQKWIEVSLHLFILAAFIKVIITNANLFKKVSIDFLTDVHSREFFLKRLNALVEDKKPFHLIYVDLNGFKKINDTYGHHVGDEYLIDVASRIKYSLRKEDIIARLGGDEFGILIKGQLSKIDLSQLLKRTVSSIKASPFEYDGVKLPITLSVGCITYPRDSLCIEDLLRKADAAMYISKKEKVDFFIFDEKRYSNPGDDLKILSELREAITNDELTVVYQPKYSIDQNKIIGCEALSRWNSPVLGQVSPEKFIEIAGKEGLINQLLQSLLIKVFDDLSLWKSHGVVLDHVGINVSAENLSSMQIISEIMTTAKNYSIDLSKVMLEVTETAIMKDPEESFKYLVMLNSLGIRLSIDDFGTGNSSFIYLKHLPISEIKIDKTFIKDMSKISTDLMIVASTIQLAKSCDIEVVAEGVENIEQMNMLRELKCNIAQGYLISKPKSADDFLKLMKEQI